MKSEFVVLPRHGQLYVDKILFQAGYPVLFTCVDSARDLFICVCCQNNEQGVKWLVSRTNSAEIVKLLKNELTIRESFTNETVERFSVNSINGEKMRVVKDDRNDWAEDSIYLPKANEYLDAEPEEFEEEIRYYGQYDLKYTSPNEQSVAIETSLDSNIKQDLMGEFWGAMDILGDLVVTLSGEIEILVETKSVRLKEAQRMLSEYNRLFVMLESKETIFAEGAKQNNIFDAENEIKDGLLIAA